MELGATILVAFLTGGGAGALVTLATPWAQWQTEKARLKTQRREKVIADGRTLIGDATERRVPIRGIGTDSRFLSLRQYLSSTTISKLEAAVNTTIMNPLSQQTKGGDFVASFRNDIEALEKKWKLI